MQQLTSIAAKITASGRMPMYLRLGLLALGLAGSVLGADLGGIPSAFAEDGGW